MASPAPTNAELRERLELLKQIAALEAQLATKDESKTATSATASHGAAHQARATTRVIECALPGCTWSARVKEGHAYCSRKCASEHQAQQRETRVTTRLVDLGGGVAAMVPCDACTYCGKPADRYAQGMAFCSSTCYDRVCCTKVTSGTCSLPDCTRPKYFDAHTNRLHDYCGRTCARAAGAL